MKTSTPEDAIAELMATPLLSGVPEGRKRTIFGALQRRPIEAGSPLIAQGVRNDRLWFLIEGDVAVDRARADGRVDRLAEFSGPAIYGTTTFFRPTGPSATIRATTDLVAWTLDQAGLDRIRQEDPEAAEALALSVVRVLSERFDLLDRKLAELLAEHADDHPRANEWANFRTRVFEEPAL